MSDHRVVALPGDGIGPEVMREALRAMAKAGAQHGVSFEVDEIPCGGKYYLEHGRDWPEGSEDRCRRADVILLGAVGWPSPTGGGPVTMSDGNMAGYNPVIGNRTKLDLYANIRPVKLYPGVQHRISGEVKSVWATKNVDMVILRENTEGLYAGIRGVLAPGGVRKVAVDTRVITREASLRIIRQAFELARTRDGAPRDGKKRVTAIVKNNVLDGCRLFHEIFLEVGAEYPDVEKDTAIVDAFTQWLVTEPERYDVCVTTNMFGDIVTDLAAVLQGGMGMAVGMNVGDHHGMFEPIHGSAPPLAGQDRANPMAMMMATAEALRWLGRKKGDPRCVGAGDAIDHAVRAVLSDGSPLTEDLVGRDRAAPSSAVAEAILSQI